MHIKCRITIRADSMLAPSQREPPLIQWLGAKLGSVLIMSRSRNIAGPADGLTESAEVMQLHISAG